MSLSGCPWRIKLTGAAGRVGREGAYPSQRRKARRIVPFSGPVSGRIAAGLLGGARRQIESTQANQPLAQAPIEGNRANVPGGEKPSSPAYGPSPVTKTLVMTFVLHSCCSHYRDKQQYTWSKTYRPILFGVQTERGRLCGQPNRGAGGGMREGKR